MGRQASELERALMQSLPERSFEGVEALRRQWQAERVHSSCGCGCGSFGFDIEGAPPASESAVDVVPVDIQIVNEKGEVVGGIAVLLRGGYLYDVDVHSFADGPLSVPPADRLRWSQ